MKIYIAGKITGDPNYKEKFASYAERVEQNGHIALNPAESPEGMLPSDYMRLCFAMIDICDKAYFMPDYVDSQGAQLELMYCRYIGKPVEFFDRVTISIQGVDVFQQVIEDMKKSTLKALENYCKEKSVCKRNRPREFWLRLSRFF